MGYSRNVPYGEARPSAADVRLSLLRYLFGADADTNANASMVTVHNEHVVVADLPHRPGDAWPTSPLHPGRAPRPVYNEARFIEVHLDADERELCVITRSADDFTSAAADGYARACAFAFLTARIASEQSWWRRPVWCSANEPAMTAAEARNRLDVSPRRRRLPPKDAVRAMRAVVEFSERVASLEDELRATHRMLAAARSSVEHGATQRNVFALCAANGQLAKAMVRELAQRRSWESVAEGVVGVPDESFSSA